MDASRDVKAAFLRKVYSSASAATETARNTYLDGLSSTALAMVMSGKQLTAASFGSSSSSYASFAGWKPDMVLSLCEWARNYISESTITLALEDIPAPVRSFHTYTTNLHVMG